VWCFLARRLVRMILGEVLKHLLNYYRTACASIGRLVSMLEFGSTKDFTCMSAEATLGRATSADHVIAGTDSIMQGTLMLSSSGFRLNLPSASLAPASRVWDHCSDTFRAHLSHQQQTVLYLALTAFIRAASKESVRLHHTGLAASVDRAISTPRALRIYAPGSTPPTIHSVHLDQAAQPFGLERELDRTSWTMFMYARSTT
jgi:hypothetical protein